MRLRSFLLLLCAAVLVLLARGDGADPPAFTGKVVIHAENDVRVIKRSELAAIFLGKKSTWGSGRKIIPTLQSEKNSVTRDFLRDVLRKSLSQYRAYWKRRLFSGGGTVPKAMQTSEEVIAFVASRHGAIGFVEESTEMNDKIVVVEISD